MAKARGRRTAAAGARGTRGSVTTAPSIAAPPFGGRTAAERYAAGKALRVRVPRSSHADWAPASNRPDPIALIIANNRTRLPELVPIRYGRMAISPFAFYRGSAVVMAWDLSKTPVSGIMSQICGDGHLSNFGLFATPERNVIFDVNDFDETRRGPWEWDVKRLAASCAIAAHENGLRKRECRRLARAAACAYREHMRELAKLGYLDVWYSRLDVRDALKVVPRSYYRAANSARRDDIYRTSHHGFPSFVTRRSGELVIKNETPLISHLDDPARTRRLEKDLLSYRTTLQEDRQELLRRYQLMDLAIKVVGVGSVGTRCFAALLTGRDKRDVLLLQVKEAQASVLEPYLGKSIYANHGQRVVHGQRLLQAASDMFLGWARGLDHDFYVRQLRDMKFSVAVGVMTGDELLIYSRLCGRTLARAHARSGDPSMIAGYLGNGDAFDRAIGEFALAYAAQTERDYDALMRAIKTKRIKAAPNL